MKKTLTKIENKIFYYKDGIKIEGKHSGIHGNVSDISDDVDSCEITDEERKRGIDIEDLCDPNKENASFELNPNYVPTTEHENIDFERIF